MYFAQFPQFLARLGDEQKVITDFFVRVGVGQDFAKLAAILLPYTIKDGERPETIAYDVYGAATYHWVILLLNGIVDPREEWPLTEAELRAKITREYDDPYGTHHHVLALTGSELTPEIVDYYTAEDVTVVTNAEYEIAENDKKRTIYLLDPSYLGQFVKNFETEVSA